MSEIILFVIMRRIVLWIIRGTKSKYYNTGLIIYQL